MLTGIFSQLLQSLLVVLLAPLFLGWINNWRAWFQNRRAAGLFQPYRDLHRLFAKEAVVAHQASYIFCGAPYIVFGTLWLAGGIIPILATDLPLASSADVIALVGLLAVGRVFMALAAMDIGTAFGGLGARREMLVASLAEPAMLMILFAASMISQSTALTTIVEHVTGHPIALYPSMAFAAVAFVLVLLAENARIPVDNPATHLELTMIHEAMLLEYSGRHLALMEWAAATKLLVYTALGIALFLPWGMAEVSHLSQLPVAFIALMGKLMLTGFTLPLLETLLAKMRLFRVPEFLAAAFLLSVIGLLTHFTLEI